MNPHNKTARFLWCAPDEDLEDRLDEGSEEMETE